MIPMNRHLEVGLVQETSAENTGVLLPEGYTQAQEWQTAVVKQVSDACESFNNRDIGAVVVFPGNMLLSVDSMGNNYYFVQENYVVCRSERKLP